MKKMVAINLLLIAILAMTVAILLLLISATFIKFRRAYQFAEIRSGAINCDPSSFRPGKMISGADHGQNPIDDHNGNSCPHQSNSMIYRTEETKRKFQLSHCT